MLNLDRFSCSQRIWLKQDPPVLIWAKMVKVQRPHTAMIESSKENGGIDAVSRIVRSRPKNDRSETKQIEITQRQHSNKFKYCGSTHQPRQYQKSNFR